MKVLFRMKHGLGDNAQFTIVMRHIKHYFPHWKVDMEIGKGKSSYFKSSANQLFLRGTDYYDTRKYKHFLEIDWPTPDICRATIPSSKPTRFLCNVLRVKPIERLYKGYDITTTPKEHRLADKYIKTLPRKPFVVVHYIAKTLSFAKSLTHEDAEFICKQVIRMGCTPVILDWKDESPLINQKTIFNPSVTNPIWENQRWSSAGTIAALIARAKLYIGVDSGPLHVAGCTNTPTIGVWHGHHPINFYDLCDNVTHLVPAVKKTIKGKRKDSAKRYFEKSYRHIYYHNLHEVLEREIQKIL